MLTVRAARPEDLPRLLEIYNHAVVTTTATFDLVEQTLDQRREWFSHYGEDYPLLVAELDGQVVGYASLSPYRVKPAYANTVESSVYVDHRCRGQGIGGALMRPLLKRAAELGYHTVVAGIVGGNTPSLRVHEKLGYQPVGCLREVGRKFDAWHDIHLYQIMLPAADR
ncbi:MAG TPA: GNAT family N-acetyltransferase [Symbiobacteriaceae bacterium]|jgi:phosphinothricin acetyltransferase